MNTNKHEFLLEPRKMQNTRENDVSNHFRGVTKMVQNGSLVTDIRHGVKARGK